MFPAKNIMTKNVISVKPEDPIYTAIKCLAEQHISGLPVVDGENRLVGVLSEMDVLDLLTEVDLKKDDTVEKYMTRNVISFSEDTSVVDICEFFQTQNKRRAPIVRDGILLGIISRHDIIKLIVSIREKIK